MSDQGEGRPRRALPPDDEPDIPGLEAADGPDAQERRGRAPLRLTEELPPHRVGEDPLEHLVEGSSADYRRARRDTARWIYR